MGRTNLPRKAIGHPPRPPPPSAPALACDLADNLNKKGDGGGQIQVCIVYKYYNEQGKPFYFFSKFLSFFSSVKKATKKVTKDRTHEQ